MKTLAATAILHLQCALYSGALSFERPQAGEAKPPRPSEWELARTVGQPLHSGFKKVEWKAGAVAEGDVAIYAVELPQYDEGFFKRLAEGLGVNGRPEPMPSNNIGAPGYHIKEPNPTNSLTWKSVYWSLVSGEIGYGNGEDNHRWDLKNQRPLATGVPTAEEALQRTLKLLPLLSISTNSIEHRADGKVRWESSNDGTWYTDQADGRRKRYVRQMNITLYQRMQEGGSTAGAGGGGQLRAGYMSDGKLAEFQFLFRPVKVCGTTKPKTRGEIVSALRNGQARTFYEHVPETITITNCALVYPQGNLIVRQTHLRPFYSVKGFAIEGSETNGVIVYIPAAR